MLITLFMDIKKWLSDLYYESKSERDIHNEMLTECGLM